MFLDLSVDCIYAILYEGYLFELIDKKSSIDQEKYNSVISINSSAIIIRNQHVPKNVAMILKRGDKCFVI